MDTPERAYDYIIAGGGAAGLSLAYHLSISELKGRSILIIDQQQKTKNDHTWCFWSDHPSPYEPILFRSWKKINFTSPYYQAALPLGKFRYAMLRSIDFYQFIHSKLAPNSNFRWHYSKIQAVRDTETGVAVLTEDGSDFQARYAFNSLFNSTDLQPGSASCHYLKQHFLGWEIKTSQPVFDPDGPTLFDFNLPQQAGVCFMYTLPFSADHALVEYTLFSPKLLAKPDYEQVLRNYLSKLIPSGDYQILNEEMGSIPMTDQPFTRRAGAHILNIGTRGGLIKASTGYAFARIQADSAAIVASLEKSGHPFDIKRPPTLYPLLDSILLQIILRHPAGMSFIFSQMFRNNPIERIFQFLDERENWWGDLRLITSLPPYRFIQALFRLKILGKV